MHRWAKNKVIYIIQIEAKRTQNITAYLIWMISFQIGTSQQAFAHYIREAIRQWHCQRRWLPGRYKIKTNSLKSRTLTEIFCSLGRRTTTQRSRRGRASLSSRAHNSSPGSRRSERFLTQFVTFVEFIITANFFSGGGGGRLVGCGCSGDICKKYFAKIFLHAK